MKGLELAENYWQEVGRPAFERACPELLEKAAVGLVGEGSECYGYDDETSQDHDWGPGFCVWLSQEDMRLFGESAKRAYDALPAEFMGFRRQRQTPMTAGRIGVMTVGDFYARYTGMTHPPETLSEWRAAPGNGMSVVTNGKVFADPTGEFSGFRRKLLDFYPEDLRKKKLAKHCALAAQQGQYNYSRCLRHGEPVAALIALGQFTEHIQQAIFLLNRRYCPYYKWAHRALTELPLLGAETGTLLTRLTDDFCDRADTIEKISALVIRELRAQGLTDSDSDFLLTHAESIQSHIGHEGLRRLHLMAE